MGSTLGPQYREGHIYFEAAPVPTRDAPQSVPDPGTCCLSHLLICNIVGDLLVSYREIKYFNRIDNSMHASLFPIQFRKSKLLQRVWDRLYLVYHGFNLTG